MNGRNKSNVNGRTICTSDRRIGLNQVVLFLIFVGNILLPPAACSKVPSQPDKSVVLAGNGKTIACIIATAEDKIAAESLKAYLHEKFNVLVDIVAASAGTGGKYNCEIILGTAKTNPYLVKIAATYKIDIEPGKLTTDGYVLRTLTDEERNIVLAAGGGKQGVFYAVGELKNYYLRKSGDSVVVLPAASREVPEFKYRWFWTWDWRMDWGGVEKGGEVMGGGSYKKKPESFLADYKSCIDYMSENGLNGLVIWGFIRDSHGGVAVSQELAKYAADRGVRILPGVGTSGYGGYYFEGNHHFNAKTWIGQHPELESIVSYEGKPVRGCPCPSKKANQQWFADGAKWLFENFQIGGVNLEMGDFFVCRCPDCRKVRTAIESNEPDYYKDMAVCLGPLIETMRKLVPDASLSYATYTSFDAIMMTNSPKFIDMIPPDAICQWTVDKMSNVNQKWPENLRPMNKHSIGYMHLVNRSSGSSDAFVLERFHVTAARAKQAGLEGLSMYGELSASMPNMELNYLAFKEYCFHPGLSKEEFTKKRLAPLYGDQLTDDLWKVIDLVRLNIKCKADENSAQAFVIAQSARARTPDYAREHWQRMVEYLRSFK